MKLKSHLYWKVLRISDTAVTFQFGRKRDLSDCIVVSYTRPHRIPNNPDSAIPIRTAITRVTGKKHFTLERVY